eukprot:2218552-Prymnesium_polylepis.1
MRAAIAAVSVQHAVEAIKYVIALSWTHVALPVLGGPSLVSMDELMHHKFTGRYLLFVWIYTALVTRFCWWWFTFADDERAATPENGSLIGRVWAAVWGFSSTSMAWVA